MSTDRPRTGLFAVPLELRDHIYSYLLDPAELRVRNADTDVSSYKYDLRLFLVNRQVYHEARNVFRRLNIFVRIETPWPEAEKHIADEGHVPIVVTGRRADAFKNAHLQVQIEAYQYDYDRDGTHKILALAQDVPAFTRMWYYSDLSHIGLNSHLRLILTLGNPYAPAPTEETLPKALQEKLLLPFGEVRHLHETTIHGQADVTTVEALRSAQKTPYATPEECLDEATRLKDAGNALLQNKRYLEAIKLYEEAFLAVHIVVRGRRRSEWADAYFETTLQSGPYANQHGQLVRLILRVKLVANICQAHLKQDDFAECKFWGMRSINLLRTGYGVEDEDDDEPVLGFVAAKEMGKIYYRTGLACRALGERDGARKLLRVAKGYLPDDKQVDRDLATVALMI